MVGIMSQGWLAYVPAVLLVLYLTLPTLYGWAGTGTVPLTTAITVLCAPVLVHRAMMELQGVRKPAVLLMALFPAAVCASNAINAVSFWETKSFLIAPVLGMLTVCFLDGRQRDGCIALVRGVAAFGLLNAVVACLQVMGLPALYDDEALRIGEHMRASGVMSSATHLGTVLAAATAAAFALTVYDRSGSRRKTVYVGMLVVIGLGLLASYSRSAIVGAVIGCAFVLTFDRRIHWRYKAGILSIVTVMSLGMLIILWEYVPDVAFLRGEDGSARLRGPLREVAARMLLAHPVFGGGLGCVASEGYRYGSTYMLEAHNTYADMAAELGMCGLLGFGAALILGLVGYMRKLTFRNGDWRLCGALWGLVGALVALSVHAFWHNIGNSELLWVVIAVGLVERNQCEYALSR